MFWKFPRSPNFLKISARISGQILRKAQIFLTFSLFVLYDFYFASKLQFWSDLSVQIENFEIQARINVFEEIE